MIAVRQRCCAISALAFLLAGCATMKRGSEATMTIITQPPGATCTLARRGSMLGQVASTPGDVTFKRESGDIAIDCTKPGYQAAHETEVPLTGDEPLAGSGVAAIFVAVDTMSGAEYRYRREIILKLRPDNEPAGAAREPLSLDNLRLR